MKHMILIYLLALSTLSFSQNAEAFFSKADDFLSKHVKNGRVDYQAIHDDPADLDELMKLSNAVKVTTADANTYQAFWINVYNLSVIKGLVNQYPIKSPMDQSGFFDKVTFQVGGKEVTLNIIENKLLRAEFNEPRFHFVLVCGAIGCPPLIDEAYRPSALDKQLQRQTALALNNSEFIKVKKNKVELSEIFKWYKEDFVENGDEISYINQFRKVPIDTNSKITYYPYNWSINKQ